MFSDIFKKLFGKAKKEYIQSPLEQHPHLSGLRPREMELLKEIVEIKHCPAGEIIFLEGDLSDEIYFLISGRVKIEKYDHAKGLQFLGELSSGHVLGEMAFLDPSPRSATAVTLEDTRVAKLSKDKLLNSGQTGMDIYHELVKNIAKVCVGRLRKTNDEYVETLRVENEQLQLQTEFGRFFIAVVLAFGVGSVFDQLVFEYNPVSRDSPLFNWAYLLVLLMPAIYLIRRFDYPLSMFGVTLKNWKSSLIQGIGVSVVAISCFYAFMFIYTTGFHALKTHSIAWFPIFILFYFFHSYIQEFIARGVVQTSLQRFLNDKRGLLSVTIASCLFAFFHLHKGLQTALVVFIFSLFFGWIYLKHKNLLGVTVIHFCLGVLGFYYGIVGE